MAARMPMIATTIISSISVKPICFFMETPRVTSSFFSYRQEAGRYFGRMFVTPLAAEQSHAVIGLSPAQAAPWQSALRPYVLVAPSCVPRPPEASTWITPVDGMAGGAELAVPTFEQPAVVTSGGIAPFAW